MTDTTADLEALQHLCTKVHLLWGSAEFGAFVSALVMDSRDGARRGLPMSVAEELLWLVKVNRVRCAMDLSAKLQITLREALVMVQAEEEKLSKSDVWADPMSGGRNMGRRYTDKMEMKRPHRRRGENTASAAIFRALTSKYSLFAIIAILSLKAAWPTIKIFL